MLSLARCSVAWFDSDMSSLMYAARVFECLVIASAKEPVLILMRKHSATDLTGRGGILRQCVLEIKVVVAAVRLLGRPGLQTEC